MGKRVNMPVFPFFILRKPHMKHFFSKFVLFPFYSAFLALIVATPLFAAPLSAKTAFSPEEVVRLSNRDREALHLPKLRFDEALSKAAEMKAHDMIERSYFAHTSPEGTTPWFFFEEAGYRYRFAGENLAIHFTDAENEHAAWMKSEKHRENILSPKYHDIGVAVLEMPWEGKMTTVTVQLFGTRIGEMVSDTEPWKNLSNTVPVVVNVSAPSEPIASPSPVSLSTSDVIPSRVVPQMSDFPYQTVSLFFLGLIGILEVCAASIVSRMLLSRFRTFRLRIATHM